MYIYYVSAMHTYMNEYQVVYGLFGVLACVNCSRNVCYLPLVTRATCLCDCSRNVSYVSVVKCL